MGRGREKTFFRGSNLAKVPARGEGGKRVHQREKKKEKRGLHDRKKKKRGSGREGGRRAYSRMVKGGYCFSKKSRKGEENQREAIETPRQRLQKKKGRLH